MPYVNKNSYNGTIFAAWAVLAALAAQAQPAGAQTFHAEAADAAARALAHGDPVSGTGQALLADALDCRVEESQLPGLLAHLREQRPGDFVQTERQYSAPDMDLYRLAEPARAWGNEGDAIVVAENRVLLAVDVSADEASWRVDRYLEQSGDSPMTGLLDARHGLVVYPAELPGLEGMTLVGCEYRIDGLSLLDDPADDWRRRPLPGTEIGMRTDPRR